MESRPLYERILGHEFQSLPSAVKAFHEIGCGEWNWTGKVNVKTGGSLLSRLLCPLLGLPPKKMDNADISVRVVAAKDQELWERSFGGKRMRSRQTLRAHGERTFLEETIGVVTGVIALCPFQDRLAVDVVGWKLFGLPMPKFLRPRGQTFEFEKGGNFHFHVDITLPIVGLLVRYEGWLQSDVGTDRELTPMSRF